MKARIKLLEDAQKPKKPSRRARKKPAPKPKKVVEEVVEEVVEVAPEHAPEPEKQGTVTAMDLDNLGALFGATEAADDEPAEAAPAAAGGELDLSALDALGGGDGAPEMDLSALDALGGDGDAKPELDLSALDALGGDDADTAKAAPADGAIAMPPPAAEPVPAEPAAPPKPQFKPEKISKPDYADDETYQEIWAEMQQEGIDKLTKVRLSEDEFEPRLEQARKDADWLGFGAKRMGEADWANTANAIAFDCDHIEHEWELDKRLNDGIEALCALKGDAAPDLPAVEVPEAPAPTPSPAAAPAPEPAAEAPAEPAPAAEAAPEPEAEAAPAEAAAKPAADPMADMSALFAEMGDSGHSNDDSVFEFDEDLSEEELAAKNAAKEAEMEEAASERPVQHGADAAAKMAAAEAAPEPAPEPKPEPKPEPVPKPAAPKEAGPVEIDETPISGFAEDEMYMQIWEDMVVETLQNLQVTRHSQGIFEERQKQADHHADRLCHAARQMGFTNWVEPLEDFAFDAPALEDAAALDAAIDKLLHDLQALRGDKPPVEAPEDAIEAANAAAAETTPEPAAEPEPAAAPEKAPEPAPAEAADVSDMDALFAEMGDSAHKNDDDVFDFDEDGDAASTAEAGDDTAEAAADEAPAEDEDAIDPAAPPHSTVEIDETPISTFAEDHLYMKIWEEMVVETLQNLGLARKWQAEFDARLKRADDTAARLLHAAHQMEFEDWIQVLEDFAFDAPVLEDDAALNEALDKVSADLQALRGDKPAVDIPAEDTYAPPQVEGNTVTRPAEEEVAPEPVAEEVEFAPPPKPMVSDTDESAQIRSDWESDDFWSWDDDEGTDAAAAPAEDATPETPAATPAVPEPAAPAPAPVAEAGPVEIDETPISSFDEDDGFRAIWQEMVAETLEGLGITRRSDDALEDRLSRAKAHADRLCHAAEQMEYQPWVDQLQGFMNSAAGLSDQNALNTALDQLIADLDLLKTGAAAVANLMAQAPQAAQPTQAAPDAVNVPTPKQAPTAPSAAQPPASPASVTPAQAAEAARSRTGKATMDDIYKFFPKG
ncbi:MAG: hypothetical protein VX083_20995, partial [Pseudomonadota bacterium]|nr:hypothetical protein [Pseudomonadota bacterium]